MGLFFGNGNPNNWNVKDTEKLISGFKNNTVAHNVQSAFKLYARLHSEFWCDTALLSNHWLRGSVWMTGQDKTSWQAAQNLAIKAWLECRKDLSKLNWRKHPHLVGTCLMKKKKKHSRALTHTQSSLFGYSGKKDNMECIPRKCQEIF